MFVALFSCPSGRHDLGSGVAFRNIGTLGDGWLERYGINPLAHEFNCQSSAGLGRPPARL
jgi:hypothetical protein